ncbi:MAG TPA: PA2779 family protein [Burkholderiaceae bacterium]|nr:PA2779 family protein [Burkholderiaceae bacterium]
MHAALVRTVAALTVTCVLGTSLPMAAYAQAVQAPATSSVSAGIIDTEAVAASQATLAQREHLKSLLARDEVRAALTERGVDLAQVQARVDALTDDEAARIAAQIDQMPAGASDILGVLFTIFIILLVTDILGLTKVFPFTRSVR